MRKPDLEVEDILRDIRRRVLTENGATDDGARDALVDQDRETDASAIRIKTYLTMADRLRSSLPPVRSYRSGLMAKIELWIKGCIERAMRWFVFDQVNFNSTVHQILGELRVVQLRQEKILTAFEASVQLEADRREQKQRVVHEAQKAVNEDQRVLNEAQTVLNEAQTVLNEEMRLQINESTVIIDRIRRNFEHRLTKLEQDES
jgi:hypothetical protein